MLIFLDASGKRTVRGVQWESHNMKGKDLVL